MVGKLSSAKLVVDNRQSTSSGVEPNDESTVPVDAPPVFNKSIESFVDGVAGSAIATGREEGVGVPALVDRGKSTVVFVLADVKDCNCDSPGLIDTGAGEGGRVVSGAGSC